MSGKRMYQVSTLQALSLGYTRPVVKVKELLEHGSTGLGTLCTSCASTAISG